MAKHNNVFLYGQALNDPKILKDDKTGEYIRGMCPILVMRGIRDFGNNVDHIKFDTPVIITGNPTHVAEMAKWKKGDMVEIKGSITTKDIIKCITCPECKEINKRKGNAVFVNPIYMSLRETNVSDEKRIELLKKRCEISNQATLVGTLCREPAGYVTDKGLHITTYQLAVNRKFRIKEDPAEIRTDFPWVKSYGHNAEDDIAHLKKGAYILVDGYIQTREIKRTHVCEKCGNEFNWKDNALEIVPYTTEFLRNFFTEEEIEEKQKEEHQNILNKIFSENEIEKPEDVPEIETEENSKILGENHFNN